MNVNFPHFYAKCNGIDKDNIIFDCVVHAARSRAGKVITFHVHLESGAHYSLLPLQKLIWKQVDTPLEISMLQPWDCFSDQAEAIVFDYLKGKRVFLLKAKMYGEYVLTIDWMENSFSDYPPEFKQGHLVKIDNGQYGLYPNNYLLFEDKSYTGRVNPGNIPKLFRQGVNDYPSVEHFFEAGAELPSR